MPWPGITDFSEAVQNPLLCFKGTELEAGAVSVNQRGMPLVFSGAFACVYPVSVGGRKFAVRCFTREVKDQQTRYNQLSEYLINVLPPSFVPFEFLERGISLKGAWYPVVRMEWVEGESLSSFVGSHLNDPDALRRVAAQWRGGPAASLRGLGIAHNDLQHGNVMVQADGNIRLVDYDGMFLPRFRGERSPELGHKNFQHPLRTAEDYDAYVDNFPSLVVYLSLLAIATDPGLWAFFNDDNLIFTRNDYADPGKSPLFDLLKKSPDQTVAKLTERLEECCALPVKDVPDLETILHDIPPGAGPSPPPVPSATPLPSTALPTTGQEYRQVLQAQQPAPIQPGPTATQAQLAGRPPAVRPAPPSAGSRWLNLDPRAPGWTGVRNIVLLTVAASLTVAIAGALLGLWSPSGNSPPPSTSSIPAATVAPAPTAMPAAVPPPSDTPTATPPAAAAPSDPSTPLPALPASVESAPTPSPTPLLPPTPVPPTPDASSPIPAPVVAAVETHFLADLVVEDKDIIFDPPNPSVGDTVIFTVSVLNQGEGDAGPSKLSYTVTRDAETILVGEVDVPSIPKGDSESVFFDWTAGAGVHSFAIRADATDQVHETANIDNNKAHLHYNGTLLADLIVESIDWSPDAPVMGEAITFSVTIRNQGEGRAGSSTLELYMDDRPIGMTELSPILSGESETASFTWDAQVGSHTLLAMADPGLAVSEADEANNETAKTFEATRFSDLVVEAVSWEPLNPSVGDEVNFWVTVRNQGTLHAADSVVELSRTSRDGASSSSKGQVSGIPAGESATATFQWQAEPGVFSLIARADVDGAVGESDEDNNEYTIDYDATALADLTVADISWEPDRPAIGEDVTVTVTLKNAGGGAAQDSGVRLFVDDAEHGEAATLTRLYPQESGTVSFGWTAETGMHTFRADVDHDNQVVESDEENNASETFEYDHTRLADLNVKEIDWEPDKPSVGDTVTFGVMIENLGEASARGFHVRFEDKSGAWQPMEETVPEELAAGQTARVSFEWSADADPHQFVVVADSREEVVESNEGNNQHTVEYSATALADLIVADIAWEPERPSVGDTVTFGVLIENRSEASARAFHVSFRDESGLSSPAEKTVSSRLAAGQTVKVYFEWAADADPHQFVAVADSREEVIESDEGNNEHTVEYGATALADLIVADIAWEPERPSVGDTVTFGVVVENRGEGAARGFHVSFGDGSRVWSPEEETVSSGLGAGQTAKVYFEWSADAVPHQFVAVADSMEDVIESNEDNNEHTVEYNATALADLIVTDIAWEPDRPVIGEEVTVTVTLQNAGDGDALASSVRLFIDDKQHGAAATLPNLSSEDSDKVTFIWIAEVGMHTFSADVDHDNRVIESDETNNASEPFAYDHTRLADLIVREIAWEPEKPSVGDKVTFEAVIDNLGQASARGFHVSFGDRSSVWQPMVKVVSGELGAGQTTRVYFEWPADADRHQFVVVADSRGEVIESSEDNNELTVEYGATVVADLVVNSIKWNPARPALNEGVTIEITVKNTGQGGSEGFIVNLAIDGTHYRKRQLDGLDVGQSVDVRFGWDAEAGPHRFTATADSEGAIAETVEDNNTWSVDYDATELADLTVERGVVSVNPESPSAGDDVTIGLMVLNRSRVSSGRFTVSLYVGGSSQPYSSESVGSLDRRDESAYVRFTWQAKQGCHNFRVVVDSGDDVVERNEDNNQVGPFEICVSARPQP